MDPGKDNSSVGTSVSNGMGQCTFSGQRDRISFIALGQRDKLKILPRDRSGQDNLSKSGTGRGTGGYKVLTACPVPSCGAKQERAEKDF